MNILTEITDLLVVDLTKGLYKLKILASRLQNKELLDWVNFELNGYGDDDKIPSYRKIPGHLEVAIHSGYGLQDYQKVPSTGFSQSLTELVTTPSQYDSIAVIEDKAKNKEVTTCLSLSPDITLWLFSEMWKDNSARRMLSRAIIKISTSSFKNIVERVRNYALDLVLTLESQLGYEIELEEILKNRKEETNNIINNYLTNNHITNIGDNNMVNIGNDNKISQEGKIQKN